MELFRVFTAGVVFGTVSGVAVSAVVVALVAVFRDERAGYE